MLSLPQFSPFTLHATQLPPMQTKPEMHMPLFEQVMVGQLMELPLHA
jgi:hypothetical protein